jgi:AraC family transcriptional regulator
MHANAFEYTALPTVQEWFAKPPIEVLKTSDALGWKHLSLTYCRLYPTQVEQISPYLDDYTLIMVLDGATHRIGRVLTKEPFTDFLSPGSFQLHTPQLETAGRWDDSCTAVFAQLSSELVPLLSEGTFRGDPQHVEIVPNTCFHDPFLQMLMNTMYNELEAKSPFGSLYVESISHTLMLHLMRHYGNTQPLSKPVHQRFSTQQIRVLTDYIDSHLDEKLTLTELAGLLNISVSYFERMFRTTFGRPPYQYVIERRVEQAKMLLKARRVNLHDVARVCGFANQSHLTRHFTRLVGVTPARFMRAITQ